MLIFAELMVLPIASDNPYQAVNAIDDPFPLLVWSLTGKKMLRTIQPHLA